MKRLGGEGTYVLGALTVFAIWLFVALPALYFPARQNSEGTEFWPPIFGYRLKVTDTLVVLFTAGLFMATWLLWAATKKLVLSAENTAERQLRAYVYFKDAKVEYTSDTWKINYRIDNFGHTPAHNVRLLSVAEVVDWTNGKPSKIPVPDQVETLGSMAPNGDFFELDVGVQGIATLEDIKEGKKAIYLTGNILYETVFEKGLRVTNFRYYIGGDQGYDSNEMSADSQGNDAT